MGLLLLNNPDIEIISAVGAVLMMLGYLPLGIKTLQTGIVELVLLLRAAPASERVTDQP